MFTATKRTANKSRLTVTVKVPGDPGQKYFSVTAEETAYRRRAPHACGRLHDEVLEHFPDLRDVVALHLSDSEGAPMHAEVNGWWWLVGAVGEELAAGARPDQSPEECRTILAEHLRLSARATSDIINATVIIARQEGIEAARRNFAVFVDDQRARWKAEADACMVKYGAE